MSESGQVSNRVSHRESTRRTRQRQQDDHLLLSVSFQCCVARLGPFWPPRSSLPKGQYRASHVPRQPRSLRFFAAPRSLLGITYSGISSWMIWGWRSGRIVFTRRLMSITWAASTVGGVVVISIVQFADRDTVAAVVEDRARFFFVAGRNKWTE